MDARYKVIKYFEDLQDDNHPYNVGDIYPREGLKPSRNRIRELASPFNLQKTVLIEKYEPSKELVKDSEE